MARVTWPSPAQPRCAAAFLLLSAIDAERCLIVSATRCGLRRWSRLPWLIHLLRARRVISFFFVPSHSAPALPAPARWPVRLSSASRATVPPRLRAALSACLPFEPFVNPATSRPVSAVDIHQSIWRWKAERGVVLKPPSALVVDGTDWVSHPLAGPIGRTRSTPQARTRRRSA